MPNHWESSARPLFVKTVFVNGNRHAILSQKDPLLQSFSRKQSRPNSSSSFSSMFSNISTGSDDLKPKTESTQHRKSGDLSSQLQSCLIKLRLPSNSQEIRKESRNEVDIDEEQEGVKENRNKENYGSKRKKLNHGKPTKKKNFRQYYEEYVNDNKLSGWNRKNFKMDAKTRSNNCCYVYNFENNKGKKNYCFVKISSKPSHLILNCSCDKNWGKLYDFCGSKDSPSDKNNILISATFQNLIMTSDKNEKLSKIPSDYLFSHANLNSCEMNWNNYVTSSQYNSLSERVIQWLDLASKRKSRHEIPEKPSEEVTVNNIERIFAGKTFLDDNNKSRCMEKSINKIENKMLVTKEKNIQKAPEDVNMEVRAEGNIETALSLEKSCGEQFEGINFSISPRSDIITSEKMFQFHSNQEKTQYHENSKMKTIPSIIESDFDYSKSNFANRLDTSVIDSTKTILNVEKFFSSNSGECSNCFLNDQTKRQILNEKRKSLIRQSKFSDHEDCIKEENFKITALKCWEKDSRKNMDGVEGNNQEITIRCEKNTLEDGTQSVKNRILSQEFEKIQRPINTPNIMRIRASSQLKQNKISWLSEGKSAWPQEKDLGRPQLHIFIPCMLSKDSSEESISECESFLGDVCS